MNGIQCTYVDNGTVWTDNGEGQSATKMQALGNPTMQILVRDLGKVLHIDLSAPK